MFNITKYYRNMNQSYNEVSPHTSQNDHHEKYLQNSNAGGGVEKGKPFCVAVRNVSWSSHCRAWYGGFLKRLKTELPYNLAILLPGINPEKTII